MKLRVAGTLKESVVDGPGIRFVIFAQGCPRFCEGCHNPHTHDPLGGELVTLDQLMAEIRDAKYIKGVTISGGEPFLQAKAFAQLAQKVRYLGKDVVTFTGYTWEELIQQQPQDKDWRALLEVTDYLIDGPFILAQRDLFLPFRGSRNQRVIDVHKSLDQGKVIEAKWGQLPETKVNV